MIDKFSILNEAKYFSSEIFQNSLVFTPAQEYIKCFSGTTRINSWKSNGMSEENIKNITKSYSNLAPTFVDYHFIPDINFNGHCLINDIFIPKKVINLHISYILNPQLRNFNTDFTLGNCLFGSVKLTKNADVDKYKYSGYSIGFDSRSEFLFTDGSFGKNGADVSSSVYNDNEENLIIGEGATQRLDDATFNSRRYISYEFYTTK